MKTTFLFIAFILLVASFLQNVQAQAGVDWQLLGNAGTTPGTHFIGSTDAQSLVFKTGNTETGRIVHNATGTDTWQFGIATNLAKLVVNSDGSTANPGLKVSATTSTTFGAIIQLDG